MEIQDQIEDKIIDCINSGAGGRLVIIKPEIDIFGADLVVEKRAEYKNEKNLHLKIISFIGPSKDEILAKDFSQVDFKADKNFYLVFVYFNEVLQKINNKIWLISSLDFQKKGRKFQSTINNSSDEYSKFLINKDELGDIILKIMISK